MGSRINVSLNNVYPKHKFESINYWTPLSAPHDTTQKVCITCSKQWHHTQTHRHKPTSHPRKRGHINNTHPKTTHMSSSAIKQGIINGTIPSAVSNTGATSMAGTFHDPFVHRNTWSTKTFMLPLCTTTTSTTQAQLHLNIHSPASIVVNVPDLHQNSSAAASLPMQTEQPSITNMKSISTTPTLSSSQKPLSSQDIVSHTPVSGKYHYVPS